jgi:pimeloyl-ACP methyl ester carboxylesterase
LSLTLLNDGKTFAWQTSDSPSHVFLHGWGRDHTDFKYFFDKVSGLFIDLPGFGKSPQPDTVWTPIDYSKWLNSVLPSSVRTIVAHSFGGRIASHYVNQFNNMEHCILVGVPLYASSKSRNKSNLKLDILKKANKLNLISESFIDNYKKKHGSIDYRNSDGLMRDILVSAVTDDLSEIVKKITTPMVLIWGENDNEVPIRVAQEAHGNMNNSRLFVLEDTGHNPFITKSEEVMRILEEL